MIKPNWDVFKAKFSENPQNNFEWFCYLLFCKKFNMDYGIFRYKNQSAIETNPIEVNDDVVAWQAKFYETSLSSHKKDLEDTLNKLKRDYPKVNRLYIYSNQEWGQNKGQMPQGQKDIEKLAKELDISLDWKLASFFESEFVTVKNDIIAKHFFTFEKSIFSTLEEMQNHSKNLLKYINTDISFNDKNFEITREKELNPLISGSNQVCIISGVGGVGKTVLVKKLYERYAEDVPFYIFKATEFELRNINDIFGDFSLSNFLDVHKDMERKTIVIDSAEKLLDLRNTDPFKELLSAIVETNWQVIFTTRDAYLKDLNYQFFEIYKIAPLNIGIRPLEQQELITISNENAFTLPKDKKLLELIRNPFYLNEYLQFYKDIDEIDYVEFKLKLWEQRIKKSKPEREKCFMEIASQRANTGKFFVDVKAELSNQCDELMKDGMLGYEDVGYFITHDIYEEWALEKIINKEFVNRSDEHDFFVSIGESLPIRRCLRNWISEKLLLEDYEIVEFIEDTVKNSEIDSFWKDELFASILLSDYSRTFFEVFKNELLSNKCSLLKRLIFILRIACKEVDDEFFKQLGIKDINLFTLEHILTKPKGVGWEALIEFTYNNIEIIGIENINFVLPIINDWNDKIRKGNTTRCAGLIALKYYQNTIRRDVYYSRDDTLETILKTIINGSYELKMELKEIIAEILLNEWKNYRDPYYDLAKFILTKLDGLPVCKVLPDEILQLADFYWTYTPKEDHMFSSCRDDVEHDFGIEKDYTDYHPASAYQSPIYWLLQINPKATMDFIVSFTNKSVRKYVSSNLASRLDNITEVEVMLRDDRQKKQYISQCLWEIYRGTSSPVSPNLLQSIHMALEKFLLEIAEKMKTEVLVSWLNYLLETSESASISSVVTSVVLANPEKTFDTAKILFGTKEFIIHDTHRLASEQGAKTLYSIGKNWGISKSSFYDNERLKTCEDKHRKWSLESLFLNYQVFAMQESGADEAKKRQEILWDILDDYYKKLPQDSEQNERDKTWRLFLARMDRRKMNITTEETNGGILIQFEPEIEPEIDEFREENQKAYNEHMRYVPLKLWADFKFKNDEKSKEYEKYDSNPQNALDEAKEILERLNKPYNPDLPQATHAENERFHLFNYQIPSCVCVVLVEHYIDKLNDEDKEFCKDVIIAKVISCVQPNYFYQVGDGAQEAIASLPKLMKLYPKEKEKIKLLLLLILFKDESVGGMISSERFNIFSMIAIHKMWEKEFEDAHSLLLGYLVFKYKYNELISEIRKENFENGVYEPDLGELLSRFLAENEMSLNKMVDNEFSISDLGNIQELDLFILSNALKMMPSKLEHREHIDIAHEIITVFARELTQGRDGDKVDYTVRNEFLKKYAYLVLNSERSKVPQLIQPFIDKFNSSEPIAEMFQEFIYAEDRMHSYDNFWFVWNQFKDKIIEVTNNGTNNWYVDKIIKSYLFAQTRWNDTTKEWHSLKSTNMRLIKDVSEQMGQHPSVLYSISKLLNDIGSSFIAEGLIWISNMLSNHSEYDTLKLERNTPYYLENLVRKYVYEEREKIKKNKRLKQKILVVLNFLIEKGSTVGYILRENII
ncbi:AVAST type 4 anti-phage nuclease Avs4 [Oceanirhabdus sp. W0125-5]|uniref:AVAST type 4 anti-phage nuclease Avs4 n=1 Tax=Oceanirhabdus sp. W0125-5 TaxID=2999116 RepID=UPI0022F336F4|nr:AVAST type 4 anti-phage nuclease Avs4 [Oceanirhabdus sp. W0125-5]WBW95285.1 ATP-binding protein [Oceanirhabdus sp. W0125-5]